MNRTIDELKSLLVGFGFECRTGHDSYVLVDVEECTIEMALELPLVGERIKLRMPEYEYLIMHTSRSPLEFIIPWVRNKKGTYARPCVKWEGWKEPIQLHDFLIIGYGRTEREAWNMAIHKWFNEFLIMDKRKALLRLD